MLLWTQLCGPLVSPGSILSQVAQLEQNFQDKTLVYTYKPRALLGSALLSAICCVDYVYAFNI